MSDSSKNKDNSSDGGDEAKKMVLRSATNSIRNKKWSEDVDEAEYELDSDGEDTDYGNSSKRGESRGRETRKGGRTSTRQTNAAPYNTRSRNPRSTRKDNLDQDDSFEEAEPKSVSTSGSRKRTRAAVEPKQQDGANGGSDESAFEDAAVSSLLGLAEASIFLLDQREPKRQKTDGTKESKKGATDNARSPDQSLVSPTKGRDEKKKVAQSPTSNSVTTTPVKQQPQGEELYDFETARTYVTSPPHFTALKASAPGALKNINPNITFNGRQRNYRRCSTHVAIAYYIFYHQKYSFLTAPPNVNFTQKYLQPVSLDPTYEARVAKERSEHFRRLMAQQQQQQQQSAMMPSYPPPPYGHPGLAAMPPQMMPGPGPMPGYPVAPPMAPMYSTAPNPAFPYMQTVPPPTMRPPNLGMEPKLEAVPLPPIKTEDTNKLNNNILPPLSSLDIDKNLLPKKEEPIKPRDEGTLVAATPNTNNSSNVNTNGAEVNETNGHATTQSEAAVKND